MSRHCDGAAAEAYVFFRCGGCGFEHHNIQRVMAHHGPVLVLRRGTKVLSSLYIIMVI